MTMRITTARAYQNAIENLQQRQSEMMDAQGKLTSGKRVERASDDPVAAARAERALASMMKTEANQRALEASRNVMTQAESALGEAGDLMQQARELVLAAGNGSYSDADRATLANSLRGIRSQLMNIANRTDGAGTWLFGGQGTKQPPFAESAGGVVYQGSTGHNEVPAGDALPISMDGYAAWMGAVDPTTGAADMSAFDVLDRLVGELGTGGQSGTTIADQVAAGLRDIDAVSGNLLSARAQAGEVLNRTDRVEQRNADAKLAAQTERSNAEDLDMVQAASDFSNQQAGYDAALKSYSMVQQVSLFDYLSA